MEWFIIPSLLLTNRNPESGVSPVTKSSRSSHLLLSGLVPTVGRLTLRLQMFRGVSLFSIRFRDLVKIVYAVQPFSSQRSKKLTKQKTAFIYREKDGSVGPKEDLLRSPPACSWEILQYCECSVILNVHCVLNVLCI